MKRMAQLPMLKNLPTLNTSGDKTGQRAFGVSLIELSELGLVNDGVPSVLRGMVEYLRQHVWSSMVQYLQQYEQRNPFPFV
ncbi:protein FAM13A-like [Trichomycterus rosablanca]|uniref:protein FAM13A-like n=1 Tax=Trichomycterus rosablanca TaxID=2290929 RepID=UPI002F34FEF1